MSEATRLMVCVATADLTEEMDRYHPATAMKSIRTSLCVLLVLLLAGLPVLSENLDTKDAEILRSGMTIACAGIGLAAGTAIGVGFSVDAIDTPLSNTLLLTIPVAAVGVTTGALAGRLIADIALSQQPSFLLSIVEGAGLGLAAGAFIGALTFVTNFAIGYRVLEVPEGYWGDPPIPKMAMALIAGGVWGGILGTMAGAVALPVLSLAMGF